MNIICSQLHLLSLSVPTAYSIQYTVYSIQYTEYSIQYTVYSIQYTVYSIQYTVYSIQYIVYYPPTPTVYSLQSTAYSLSKWVVSKASTEEEGEGEPVALSSASLTMAAQRVGRCFS
jgi:uncharacterized membrane protein YesL